MCDNKVWERRSNRSRLHMDDIKKDMFQDEIPERTKSSSFDVPLENEEE